MKISSHHFFDNFSSPFSLANHVKAVTSMDGWMDALSFHHFIGLLRRHEILLVVCRSNGGPIQAGYVGRTSTHKNLAFEKRKEKNSRTRAHIEVSRD